MKKFSTRLFSLLAVFCLVFFSFPLVSSASNEYTSKDKRVYYCLGRLEGDYMGGTVYGYLWVRSNVKALGLALYDKVVHDAFGNQGIDVTSVVFASTSPAIIEWGVSSSSSDYSSIGNWRRLPGGGGDASLYTGSNHVYGESVSWFIFDEFRFNRGFKYIGPHMSSSELTTYIDSNINSPLVNNPSLDSGLGSFVLGSNNAWANRIYGNNEYVGSFMTILRDTTTTGKKWGTDFDTLQYYTGVDHFTKLRVIGNNEDLGSFMSNTISVASDSQLTNGRGGHHFTVSCPEDFRKPMASALEKGGQGSYQQIYDGINAFFTQLINNNSYSFKPVVVVRPYNSKTGAYGNWLRVTSGTISKSTLNSSQNGSSLIGSSSDDSQDPTIKEPTGSVENKGVVSSGDTLDNAINNSYSVAPITNVDPSIVNNNYPDFYNQPEFQNSPSFSNNPNIVVTQSGIVSGGNNSVVINNDNNVSNNLENINQAINGDSSGNDVKGSVLSNIFGLLGMITAVPKMLSVLFGWLPSWALTCAGVAFALVIPLIIFKILRG